jgi:hypothetical protein
VQEFSQNYNDVSGALQLRITSNRCKNIIPQRGFVGERIHGTIQMFYRERKRAYEMPYEEIHLWIKASH